MLLYWCILELLCCVGFRCTAKLVPIYIYIYVYILSHYRYWTYFNIVPCAIYIYSRSLLVIYFIYSSVYLWEGNRQKGQESTNRRNRLQMSDIFYLSLKQQKEIFPSLYKIKRRVLLKFCVAMMAPGST